MVSHAHLIRRALVPLLGATLLLTGCSRGPATAEAALYDYVAAVNARDRGALEKLAPEDPTAYAGWVLLSHAPERPMEMAEFRIEMRGIPNVSYAWVKWSRNGGVPKDGAFVFGRDADGHWTVGFLNEGPGRNPSPSPKASASSPGS